MLPTPLGLRFCLFKLASLLCSFHSGIRKLLYHFGMAHTLPKKTLFLIIISGIRTDDVVLTLMAIVMCLTRMLKDYLGDKGVEYNVSYVYHAMFAYFDRDNVALRGLAKFFKESSEEERGHAEKLMEYQNKRGGRVKLQSIMVPLTEYDHPEKGDALYAMELALSLEKLTNEKLLNLHAVATRSNDPQLADFVESEFLNEQVEAIKKISEYVAQLRRVGKGHGVWHFDQVLLHEGAAA